jgi:hypothetical protein
LNKSSTFKLIYSELREALSENVAAEEVLACAQLVLDVTDPEKSVGYSLREPRNTLESTPVYEIFENRGWQLVASDIHQPKEEKPTPSRHDFFHNELGLNDLRMCA